MAPTVEQLRFQALIKQLTSEGMTQKKIGEQLGVHQTAVSQYISGKRWASGRQVAAVVQWLGLDRRFFDDTSLRNPRYRDHLRGSKAVPRQRYEAFDKVLTYYPPAQEMHPEVVAMVDAIDFGVLGGVVDEEVFEAIARALRRQRLPITVVGGRAPERSTPPYERTHVRKRRPS